MPMHCPRGQRPGLTWGAKSFTDGCDICPCGKYSDRDKNYDCNPATSCKPFTCDRGSHPFGQATADEFAGCKSCPGGRYQPQDVETRCIDDGEVAAALAALDQAKLEFTYKINCTDYFTEVGLVDTTRWDAHPHPSPGLHMCTELAGKAGAPSNCTLRIATSWHSMLVGVLLNQRFSP